MDWLCKAQDITDCGGCSGEYSLYKGWGPPYPETTGYIIPTFLQYAQLADDGNFIERAIMMGDWEIQIQLPSGAVRGGPGINKYPIVFNTGQVILGWMALYEHTKQNKFMDAALKAADWLISVQDHDGKWSMHAYHGIPHAYHSRVAWALLEVFKHTNDMKYRFASEKSVAWVLSLANENAWFHKATFDTKQEHPLTHTIAYTLRGLLESSLLLGGSIRQRALSQVIKASENIMIKYELRKRNPRSMPLYLPATLNDKWHSNDTYSCLTGNVQLAILWLKIFGINNDARLLNAALKIIDQVKMTQKMDSRNPGIRGGIPGSYPLWGNYLRFSYPNWAAKFFADAIMLQETVIQELKKEQT